MPPGAQLTSDSDLESVLSLQETTKKPRRNSVGPKYFCSVAAGCGASFKRLDHLDRHEYHHTGLKKHVCFYENCGKAYSIVTHLKRHLRTIHERPVAKSKSIRCSMADCTKLFSTVGSLQRHVRDKHEQPKVYACDHCEAHFTQKLKKRRHEIAKHTGAYAHKCDKCGRGFHQRWQHEKHVPVCKVYPCGDCTLKFDKWTLYIKHCRDANHGRKYYKCEHCERSYSKPSELRKHVEAKHQTLIQSLGEAATKKPYTCKEEGCGRAYAYERNLRQHALTVHIGQRFECTADDCQRCFSSSQNLSKHLARDHYGQKPKTNTNNVESDPAIIKVKTKRKKRKDAGQPVISNLAKLANLVVDKDLNKLLRVREPAALERAMKKISDGLQTVETMGSSPLQQEGF